MNCNAPLLVSPSKLKTLSLLELVSVHKWDLRFVCLIKIAPIEIDWNGGAATAIVCSSPPLAKMGICMRRWLGDQHCVETVRLIGEALGEIRFVFYRRS